MFIPIDAILKGYKLSPFIGILSIDRFIQYDKIKILVNRNKTMRYKGKKLTFKRTGDFDGMTDCQIPGDGRLTTGKCVEYHRSGWYRTWYIMVKGEKTWMVNTFETLVAVDGVAI